MKKNSPKYLEKLNARIIKRALVLGRTTLKIRASRLVTNNWVWTYGDLK